ncbi:hypothetical protein PCANC_21193 [Puccinia coronata f. sp. avenae]|uniref:Uncharacterized protein n=1 Tax=Puccinia coronata f. sp. avenae TaxID=200324 RepID=A0A2N5TY66_9BASI|nr:hypothetical protein PCANC_21193 [Puccinia coronata f. sp. avenae]
MVKDSSVRAVQLLTGTAEKDPSGGLVRHGIGQDCPTRHRTGLSDAMSDKPVRPSCPTWDWTILSDPMSDKVVRLISSTSLKYFEQLPNGRTSWSNELKLIGQMLSDTASDTIVRCCAKQTSRTKVFDNMGSDNSVRSHVGQASPTGLSDMASDNHVRCRVGQAHRMGYL